MESIYNWIEHEEPPQVKGKRYRSKYDPSQPPTGSTFVAPNSTTLRGANLGRESTEALQRRGTRAASATIGPPKEALRPDPRSYRRNAKASAAPQPSQARSCAWRCRWAGRTP